MTDHTYKLDHGGVVERFDMRHPHYRLLAQRRARATGRKQEIGRALAAAKRGATAALRACL